VTAGTFASTALLSACGLSAAAAVAGLFASARPMRRVHHAAMVASALVGVLGSGVFLIWRVPPVSLGASPMLFGAPIVVDRLSAFFLLLLHLVAAMAAWFGSRYSEDERGHYPLRAVLPLTAMFVLSMQGVLISSGVASFLLFWEAMSLSAFLLVMADGEEESRKAALLYLAVAQFGAGALIVGSGMAGAGSLFATFGSLASSAALLSPGASALAAGLVLFAFASKAGLAPFHAWLPEAHPRAPSQVSALMSGAMLKVAIYGLLRYTWACWPQLPAAWGVVLIVLGLSGAVVAVIYANIARDLKRILAWSSVENIGLAFTMFGFQLLLRRGGWPALADLALTAMFLHLLAHALFKTGLFLGAGAIMHGTRTGKIELLGGLASRMPLLSAGVLVLALSAAALPPAGSFVAELVLLQSVMGAFSTHDAGAVAAAITVLVGVAFVSGLAVFAMVRLFAFTFLAEPRGDGARAAVEPPVALRVPVLTMAAGVVLLGLATPWISPLVPIGADIPSPQDVAASMVATGSLLWLAPALAAAAVAACVVGWLLRRLLGPATRIRRYHTWDCGQPIDSTMEYTATGFSAPVRFFLRDIVRAEKHVVFRPVVPSNPWIRRGEMEFRKAGGVLAGMYFPIARVIEGTGAWLKQLQNGVIQFYIALILATLLLTLWVAL
jgi:formate hydrogenlyase subunit 3/multisubunit Na+/H+ antiporter MnhD subunit